MSDDAKTVRMVPVTELEDLARKVRDMRKAQDRFFKGRHGPDRAELIRESLDHEGRVDALVKDILARAGRTPSMFAGGKPEGGAD